MSDKVVIKKLTLAQLQYLIEVSREFRHNSWKRGSIWNEGICNQNGRIYDTEISGNVGEYAISLITGLPFDHYQRAKGNEYDFIVKSTTIDVKCVNNNYYHHNHTPCFLIRHSIGQKITPLKCDVYVLVVWRNFNAFREYTRYEPRPDKTPQNNALGGLIYNDVVLLPKLPAPEVEFTGYIRKGDLDGCEIAPTNITNGKWNNYVVPVAMLRSPETFIRNVHCLLNADT